MAYVATSDNASVTYLSDNGELSNSLGVVAIDVLTPHLGNRDAMVQAAITNGSTLIEEGTTGLNQVIDLGLEPGTVFVFYCIRDNSQPATGDNVVFDEQFLNVGLTHPAGLDAFRDGLTPDTIGIEDLLASDRDFNDLEFAVQDVSEVKYALPV